jgi:hypothetical protein
VEEEPMGAEMPREEEAKLDIESVAKPETPKNYEVEDVSLEA